MLIYLLFFLGDNTENTPSNDDEILPKKVKGVGFGDILGGGGLGMVKLRSTKSGDTPLANDNHQRSKTADPIQKDVFKVSVFTEIEWFSHKCIQPFFCSLH